MSEQPTEQRTENSRPETDQSASASTNQSISDGGMFFRVSDTRFLIVFAVLVAILLGVQCVRFSRNSISSVEIQRASATEVDYRIDINDSTWIQWAQLPNIGETTARRIVADRETNGPFESVDDVGRVSGIGPQTLASLQQWLVKGESVEGRFADVAR